MTVKFNATEEYVNELEKNAPVVHRKIVRVTKRAQITNMYPIQRMYVTATYVAEGDIIRLDRYVGDLQGDKRTDDALYRKADAIINSIEKASKELGLEPRAGMYEQ